MKKKFNDVTVGDTIRAIDTTTQEPLNVVVTAVGDEELTCQKKNGRTLYVCEDNYLFKYTKVKFSPSLASRTISFCLDELNYHIDESGCAEEYHDEILAQIELLFQLGEKDDAKTWLESYKEKLEDAVSRANSTDEKHDLVELQEDLNKFEDYLLKGAN